MTKKECPFCTAIIAKAKRFAEKAHKGQERKYNKQPYIVHPERVSQQISLHPHCTGEMIAAAFLHDVVEDCGVSLSTIRAEFGNQIADLVGWLTNPSKGSTAPRAERKKLDREHISRAPLEAKLIKIVDRLDNISDLCDRDGRILAPLNFVDLYLAESKLLLQALAENEPNPTKVGGICTDTLFCALSGAISMLEDTIRLFRKEVADVHDSIRRKQNANSI